MNKRKHHSLATQSSIAIGKDRTVWAAIIECPGLMRQGREHPGQPGNCLGHQTFCARDWETTGALIWGSSLSFSWEQ